MAKSKIHLDPKANSNGFDKNPENINKQGRPKVSPRAILKELLSNDDEYRILSNEVKRIEDNGDVILKMPRMEYILLKMLKHAASGKPSAIQAVKLIFDQLEPKEVEDDQKQVIINIDTSNVVLKSDNI